jgi:hypothetical protein
MNRDSVKSSIIAKNVPSVSNATLTAMLNTDLADNVRFREDVGAVQNSSTSSINVDFTGKDRVDLTRTGGPLVITVSGMGDGEEKALLITKTAGQAITFSNVVDVTDVKENVLNQGIVFYEVRRKGSLIYSKAWVETVKTATESIRGVLRVATQTEANSLSGIETALTPGRLPTSSQSQRGAVKMATNAEYAASSALPPSSAQVKVDINAIAKFNNNLGMRIAASANVTLAGALGNQYFVNPIYVSGLACAVLGTGHRRITHNIGHTNYVVLGSCNGSAQTPMYFGTVEKTAAYFDVSTGDDNSKNSVAFDFVILLFTAYQA